MAHRHHHHAPDFGRAFAIGIALNTGYVVVEAGAGLAVGSLGLVADAGHNASDVLSLIVAWVAANLARRAPLRTAHTARHRGGPALPARTHGRSARDANFVARSAHPAKLRRVTRRSALP